jgi:phage terminase small subunit
MTAALISQMRGLAAEFGIGPSSRSRIKAGNGKEKDGETERFFG